MGDDLSVAMFHTSRPAPTGRETVVGAGVAVTTFLDMLDRHGKGMRLSAFVADEARAAVEKHLRRQAGRRRTRVVVRPYRDLYERFDELAPSVWHDSNADVRRPFQLRAIAATRLYPITVTHHTVSYAFQLHDWFLALLLGDVRTCDSIICTSRAAKRAIANLLDLVADALERANGTRVRYRGRLDLVPLGVDVETFRPRPKRALRKRLGLPTERPIALWVGRFSALDKADLLPLLRVFADLVRARRGAQRPLLVLAGTDRRFDSEVFADYARRLGIRDAVKIVKFLDPAERHLWFAAADVFVSPVDNIQETFGLTPIEAMACGVPVIVADWDGYRDTVEEGVTGFRIPTLWARCDREVATTAAVLADGLADQFTLAQTIVVDPAALGDRLAALLDHEELRRDMAAAARAHAVAAYGWDVIIGRYRELWRDLVARTRGRAFRRGPNGAYALPSFFDAFEHYATTTLEPRAVVALTPFGRATLAGHEPLPVYHADGAIVRDDVLEAALGCLDERGARLDAVAGRLARRCAVTNETAVRHVMWLLKYGLAVAS